MRGEKILVALDFDETIVNQDTTGEVVSLIKDRSALIKANDLYGSAWFDYCDRICDQLEVEGITADVVQSQVEKMELTPHAKELLEYLRGNQDNYKVIILSGTMNIFIQWILRYNGLSDVTSEIYSHKGYIDERNFLRFRRRSINNCELCKYSLCKGILLKEILRTQDYEKVVFIADGLVDYCIAVKLSQADLLFPRKNYKLYKKLYEEGYASTVVSKIYSWEDSSEVLEKIKEEIDVAGYGGI